MNEQEILIISGATASGKSELAKKIALKNNGVIINCDALQIYKNLPILSAQPTKDDLKTVPHLLYSTLNYDQDSSVAIWLDLARSAIFSATKVQQLPIIVGGSGLYIAALLEGLSPIPNIDKKIREDARALYEKIGREEFTKILFAQGDKNEQPTKLDKQRLIRRLEILEQTGKTIDYWQNQPRKNHNNLGKFIHFNLEIKREILYQNCNRRFAAMVENGAVDEVKNFMKNNLDDNLPIAKTIGYLEIKNYLQNQNSKTAIIEKVQQRTRNYAKRQLTWFRNKFVFNNNDAQKYF